MVGEETAVVKSKRVGWERTVFLYDVRQQPASQPVQSVRFGAKH